MSDNNENQAGIDGEGMEPPMDVHASKISPNDPRLKLEQPKSRTLKKGPIIALICSIVGIILIAFVIALTPNNNQLAGEETPAEPSQQRLVIPEVVRNAPAVIEPEPEPQPVKEEVPALGPKLPGDLGSTMVQPQQPVTQIPANNTYNNQPSPEQQRQAQLKAKAYESGVFFSGGSLADNIPQGASTSDLERLVSQLQGGQQSGLFGESDGGNTDPSGSDGLSRQNMQQGKKSFIAGEGKRDSNYLSGRLSQPRSPYEVKAGAIIPVSLITGINSDLPGEIIGQVRENVYDTVTGNHLLIPQGSRLMAAYDSSVAFGQERVLVCWNRLIRPDGSSINLECSPGVDLEGYGGFADKVDNHWGRLIGGVVLSSVLAATASSSQGDISGENATFDQAFASNAGEEINSAGQQITRKNLNIQPTIKIRPGFSVNVLVNKDIILAPYNR